MDAYKPTPIIKWFRADCKNPLYSDSPVVKRCDGFFLRVKTVMG